MRKRSSKMKKKHAIITRCISKIDDENNKNNYSMMLSLFFWFSSLIKRDWTFIKKNVIMWSIYVIIKNLNNQYRRSQIRSSFVFLKKISIIKIGKKHSNKIKWQIYHKTMNVIIKRKWLKFQANMYSLSNFNINFRNIILQRYYSNELNILCANEFIKKCYSIIIDFMTNYEEQVIITRINNEKHCSICQMFLNCRENLKNK